MWKKQSQKTLQLLGTPGSIFDNFIGTWPETLSCGTKPVSVDKFDSTIETEFRAVLQKKLQLLLTHKIVAISTNTKPNVQFGWLKRNEFNIFLKILHSNLWTSFPCCSMHLHNIKYILTIVHFLQFKSAGLFWLL